MPPRPSPRGLVSASAAQAAVSFVNFGLPAVGPELRDRFGLGLAELGAVLTVSLFGSGLAFIAAGIAVDRFARRVSTLAGTALGTIALAAAASADTTAVLLLALAVPGVGTAVVPIAGASALFRTYQATNRPWALGVRQMAVPLGGTIAAVAMPLLTRAGGVELALAVGAVGVATTGLVFALLPEEGRKGRPRGRNGRSEASCRHRACNDCSLLPPSTSWCSRRFCRTPCRRFAQPASPPSLPPSATSPST